MMNSTALNLARLPPAQARVNDSAHHHFEASRVLRCGLYAQPLAIRRKLACIVSAATANSAAAKVCDNKKK